VNFYLNLFSVETWEAFKQHGAEVSGFRVNQKIQASKIETDSILLCYVVKLSRWVGALEITGQSFEDDTPIFKEVNDPFVVRFPVSPLTLLSVEQGIPVQEEEVWNRLQWTKDIEQGSPEYLSWGANFQRSLRPLPEGDGEFLLELLRKQSSEPTEYPLTNKEKRILTSTNKIKTESGEVEVEIPDEDDDSDIVADVTQQLRESLLVQAELAKIGSAIGLKIWLPRSDRTKLEGHLEPAVRESLIDDLSLYLSYEDVVIRTIENIDVLWFDRRTIVRAFEVEHTTAVNSGLLRMADLLTMLPNLDVKFHIVADHQRRDKVFKEIKRPVFQMMEGQLGRKCTFMSYASVREISNMQGLEHMRDSIVDGYAETQDY